MTEKMKRMLANDKMRYLIAGGCTTGVNLVAFFLLRTFTTISRNTSNAIAIAMAIAFAYFANKFFVFQSRKRGVLATCVEAVQFVGARLVSMLVEILGFAILCDTLRMPELVSKLAVQFIVLVLNYVFSKFFVFRKKRPLHESLLDHWCYLLSFGIVATVLLVLCIIQGIAPFGDNAITLVDSVHQYLPFFSEYRDKLLHEGSLFYTWNVALGSNFVSLGAYYLMSPFNFLLLLFSKESIAAVTCFLMCLKIALTAAAMTHYLSYRGGEKQRNPGIVAVSVGYAFSNYVISYNWNTMWLDCIMIFPLIMLGFERMMEKQDPKLYVLSLFYALYCNYYIGYIICLFLVLWFFVYRHGGVKKFFTDGLWFAWYSLLSGLVTAFVLLPAYLGIKATAAGDMALPKGDWYGSIFVMLKQLFVFTEPMTNQTFDGGVNLYCGSFAVLAMFLYLFVKERPFDKIKKYLLLGGLLMSFNHETLNYIWHGMHDQYGIPNRFSFLFIFVILVMAYDVILHLSEIDWMLVLAGVLFALALLFSCHKHEGTELEPMILYTSIVLILLYGLLCILRSTGALKQTVFVTTIGCVCLLELVANAVYGFMDNGYTNYMSYYETSPAITKANVRVRELAQEQEAGFYRSELMNYKVLDEASWHNMPSVSTFNSTVLGDVVTTMGRLGFYTGANEFLYRGSTPFTNSLFNVRYLLQRAGDLDNYGFNYVENVGEIGIFENPYPTSLGFAVSRNVLDWDRDAFTALNAQNILAYDMTGYGGFFREEYPQVDVTSDGAQVNYDTQVIRYTPDESGPLNMLASFTVTNPGDYYINCRGNYITKLRISINGQLYAYDRYQIQAFHLGRLEAGDFVAVEYEYSSVDASPGLAYMYVSTFDEQAYDLVYGELTANLLDIEKVEDGYVKGSIDIPEGQMLFTSIPYDKGWSVRVDGEQAELCRVAGSFIGVELEVGEHEIEFSYVPYGFKIGTCISVGALALLMGSFALTERKKRYKKMEKTVENKEDEC